jgi:uncharacterized protein YbjQ (UPF0145 family)
MAVDCKLTGLSGNEIYCMRLKGLTPSGVVIGNSIQSMGLLGGVRSAFRGIVGGEIPDVTNMIHEGRQAAFVRMRAEADREQVHGVVGVNSELRNLGGNSEFLFVGSGVSGPEGTSLFTSAGDAQELYCHMDAGYEPREFVFGNIAYSVGAVVGIKTYIIELGSSLIEIFAVGTAVRKLEGVKVQTQVLPAQAIIRDKDTWLSGSGGFDLTSMRAGG